MSLWNPDIYMKFGNLRTRPAMELAARLLPCQPKKVYDLGCGPGNSTEVLKNLFPDAELIGVDFSEDMLARAAKEGPKATSWEKRDLRDWVPQDAPDVIYSNATYQWIDGHQALFPGLFECLAPGGKLAIQMPANFDAPSHVLLRKTAREGAWAEKVVHEIREAPVAAPRDYYNLFAGAKAIDIWGTEYAQVLEGDDPVFNWVSGTALRPFLQILEGEEREAFCETYRAALQEAYPKSKDGTTLFPFQRLFMVIEKERP